MIASSLVAEAERLIRETRLSDRGIARRTGISRATVSEIRHGRRPDYEAHREERFASNCPGPFATPAQFNRVRRLARMQPTKPLNRCGQYTSLLVSIRTKNRWRGSLLEEDLIKRLGLPPRDEFDGEPDLVGGLEQI
jgi:hypothetical protein